MTVKTSRLPKKYHDAVVRWQETFLQDMPLLKKHWKTHFPKQPEFELCAFHDCSVCPNIEVGLDEGKPKFCGANEMDRKHAAHLLKAVKAQASTELGSIQQHRLTLARAQEEEDQFRILRMMAEELRHGYQMFHLMLTDDWTQVSEQSGEDMFEEVLNMRTGSHVLGAFNVDFDSFLDNATFCAVIDRVGKYQLTMQKVSAYKPMSESMPPMLQEEAFHLATGVTPLRRWAKEAGAGTGTISMDMMQRALFKWMPRGYDMFGDERGGGTNVKLGLKDKTNIVALNDYIEEMSHIIDDINVRHLRARVPGLNREKAEAMLKELKDGVTQEGVKPEDILRGPDAKFLRRRGPHAYLLYDVEGNPLADLDALKAHLVDVLPDSYRAGRDYKEYLELCAKVAAGELEQAEAVGRMPNLSRVGGACPCANAVRWIDPAANGNGSNGNGKA